MRMRGSTGRVGGRLPRIERSTYNNFMLLFMEDAFQLSTEKCSNMPSWDSSAWKTKNYAIITD